jgi:hypothetical protein
MREPEVHEVARQMMATYGAASIARAAKEAVGCEERGEGEEARTWRRIENALKLMRGPHQS